MNLTLSHCFILVDDQDKALAFYRDVLGLEVLNDVAMDDWGMPWRWITLGVPGQPGIEIGLDPMVSKAPADQEPLRALVAKGALAALIFETDDCDATFEKIRQAGAEVLQEPIDQPYGVRDCAFRDPSGNMVRFSQRRAG
ncbi:VOC family protein [Asanoa sp. NPDC049573]|uniref:VOC family protein n=1 Tax=Asanoa sp. NPDC049573 TaxID=3155396 RepID=UPI003429EBB6